MPSLSVSIAAEYRRRERRRERRRQSRRQQQSSPADQFHHDYPRLAWPVLLAYHNLFRNSERDVRLHSRPSPSQRDPQPSVDGEGLRRPERLRIGYGRAGHELPGLDQAAGRIITLIENVLGVAINLHLLVTLVGGVQAEDRVAGDLRNRVVLVAEDDLT